MSGIAGLPASPGVYCLRHRRTHDCYVGSASNIRKRAYSHFSQLRRRHDSRLIAELVERAGADFDITVLELTPVTEYIVRERHWIAVLNPTLNANRNPGNPRPLDPTPKVTLTAKVTLSEYRQLAEIAAADERSVAYIVAKALREYLERHGHALGKRRKPS